MKSSRQVPNGERGGAAANFLIIFVVIVLVANAGYHYIPVAYQGASFQQEMDTAVVKGLSAPANMKPVDVVKAHIQRAAGDYEIPSDAVIEVIPNGRVIQAHVAYRHKVDILPFGIYKYNYDFDYTAIPQGYLLKQ